MDRSVGCSVYKLSPSVVNDSIIYDLFQHQWRLGALIGKGSYGEIFLASNVVDRPVTTENAKYVAKVEPHYSGGLFTERARLLRISKTNSISWSVSSGIPEYIASGSFVVNNKRYRFLIIKKLDHDLHSLIRNSRINEKYQLILGVKILDILEKLHNMGYCHNDLKAQNIMLKKCKYLKSRSSNMDTTPPKHGGHYRDKLRSANCGGNIPLNNNISNVKHSYNLRSKNVVIKRKICGICCSPKISSSNASSTKNFTRQQKNILTSMPNTVQMLNDNIIEEECVFLIDYGLATTFMRNGSHKPFVMDKRYKHDGTLEFTSRDAHMGAHSRRSDLECLAFNLIFWSQGYLPWKEAALHKQYATVHRAKEYFMTNVSGLFKEIYGTDIPKYLEEFLSHINQLTYEEHPDYSHCRSIFQREFEQLGFSVADMRFNSNEIKQTAVLNNYEIKPGIKKYKNILTILYQQAYNTHLSINIDCPITLKTRSMSSKAFTNNSKFSLPKSLLQDPDLIARNRAEKEFECRDRTSAAEIHADLKYEGKPTYAILQYMQKRIKARCCKVKRNGDYQNAVVAENNANKLI